MSSSKSLNKRIFPRYKIKLDFVIDVAGEQVSAKLTDISISGLGLLINKDLPYADLSALDIRINNIALETAGKIMWTEKKLPWVRLGLYRTGPLQGNILHCRLADMILGIRKTGRTGVLQITTPSCVKEMYFKNGEAVFVTADEGDKEVRDILLSSGKINLEQYDRAFERTQKTGGTQEAELVAMGYITPEDLVRAVRQQTENIFLRLLELEQGSFFFRAGPLPSNRFVSLPINAPDLIYRAAKTLRDKGRTRTLSPKMNSLVYFTPDGNAFHKDVKLAEHEKKVLLLMNGVRSVQEIVSNSPVNEAETLRIILALSYAQIVEVIDADNAAFSAREQETGDRVQEIDLEVACKIEKLYKEYKSLGYYGVLNISRNASLDEIKHAYHKMAKEYHPDMHLHFNSDSLKEQVHVIFSYINEAYRALSSSGRIQQVKINPGFEGGENRNRKMARQKFDEGRRYFNKQYFEQALTFFGQAAYLDGSMPDYHFYYGLSLIHNKKMKDAEASLRKALQLDPYNSDYATELGYIYLQLGFKARARNALEKALKYDPSNQRASDGLKRCSQ